MRARRARDQFIKSRPLQPTHTHTHTHTQSTLLPHQIIESIPACCGRRIRGKTRPFGHSALDTSGALLTTTTTSDDERRDAAFNAIQQLDIIFARLVDMSGMQSAGGVRTEVRIHSPPPCELAPLQRRQTNTAMRRTSRRPFSTSYRWPYGCSTVHCLWRSVARISNTRRQRKCPEFGSSLFECGSRVWPLEFLRFDGRAGEMVEFFVCIIVLCAVVPCDWPAHLSGICATHGRHLRCSPRRA